MSSSNVKGLKFVYVCDLFEELEKNRTLKAATAARAQDIDDIAIRRWFQQHRGRISSSTTKDKLALLSCLVPCWRPDRVLGLSTPALARVIGRCLLLGSSRFKDLERWRTQGGCDFGECVERVMRQTDGEVVQSDVTVTDISDALDKIAAGCRFSSPEIMDKLSAVKADEALRPVFRKLTSREGKWLVRLILKERIPQLLPELAVFKHFHFLYPKLLSIRGSKAILPYSKSGKDSTADRIGIHNVVRESLDLTSIDQHVDKCILEGELLVWSDREQAILPFHALRKHVARRGFHIGTKEDSQPHPWEHLFIVLFDILLLNEKSCLTMPYKERKELLCKTVRPIQGRSMLAEAHEIDFSRPDALADLKASFARAIAKRWEGLVLKRIDDPYLAFAHHGGSGLGGCWVKLKKDYLPGLGDTADFAIVGAAYDPASLPPPNKALKNIRWTTFFIGCLEEDSLVTGTSRPSFRVVNVIDHNNLPANVLRELNSRGVFSACDVDDESMPFSFKCNKAQLRHRGVVFRQPFVVEMYGAGFERPSDARYWALRFPRVTKIHDDRTWRDAITFQKLQEIADRAMSMPEDLDEEVDRWAARLTAPDDGFARVEHASPALSNVGESQEMLSLLSAPLQLVPIIESCGVTEPMLKEKPDMDRAVPTKSVQGSEENFASQCVENVQTVRREDCTKSCSSEPRSRAPEFESRAEDYTRNPSSTMFTSQRLDAGKSVVQSSPTQGLTVPFLHDNTPIMLGTSIEGRESELLKYLRRSTKVFKNCPSFLDAVSSQDCYPSKSCRGVVLVNTDKYHAGKTVFDISQMGNALAARRKAGKLKVPGFVVFLHWRVLKYTESFSSRSGSSDELSGDWISFAKRFYAGSFKWPGGLPPPRRLSECSPHKRRRLSSTDGDEQTVIPDTFAAADIEDSSQETDFGLFSTLEETKRKEEKAKNDQGTPIRLKSKILAITPDPSDCNCVYVAQSAAIVQRLHLETKEIKRTYKGPTAPVTSVALSPSGDTLFAGCWDRRIWSWDVKTAAVLHKYEGHSDFVKSVVCVVVDGREILVTSGSDAQVITWDVKDRKKTNVFKGLHARGIQDLALDPESTGEEGTAAEEAAAEATKTPTIYTAGSDRTIRAVKLSSTDPNANQYIEPITEHDTSVWKLFFDTDGDLWTASADKTAKCLGRHQGWKSQLTLDHPDYVRDVVVHERGGWAITACRDEEIRVWNRSTGELYHTFSGHFEEVTGLTLAGNDEDILVSVSIDGTVRQWPLDAAGLRKAKEEAEKPPPEPQPEKKEETNALTEEEEKELAELMDDLE
ncbi:hypothetical protein KEM55_004587 [Ascosphaera atra]|nr:hypothetical protein KEM55_004587 [Ascosphaera atra]